MYNEETNTWSKVEQKCFLANTKFELEGRVYYIVNNFPIDSGIRIAHGSKDSMWDDVANIGQNAALGFMVVKR